nr:immunoglobulin heavy chain junction region [Mus musculus]MBK4187959.1 immunoglobulin heavy chain junction region [Mus musculus]MBK4187961.1 immunoglobulin heavy chain junction region [Mus musculus]
CARHYDYYAMDFW